jgi:transmembrane sensor
MEQHKAKQLIDKYLSGKSTIKEKTALESWYLIYSENSKDALPAPDYLNLEQEMWPIIEKRTDPGMKKMRLSFRITIAAAVIVIISGLYFYNRNNTIKQRQQSNGLNRIVAGKNAATLTLANGKVITLSHAKTGLVVSPASLVYNDGSVVQDNTPSSVSGAQMIAATPRGGEYQLTLPDGTKVWLNAESKLEFPSNFKNVKQRIVRLSGEGYFEVAKLSTHVPFIVKTGKQMLEVLGTHFNINSYPDEGSVKTTLLEGSVRIWSQKGQYEVVLKPNEQSVLTGSSPIQVKEVDTDEALAWKNGDFIFNNDELESIMRKVARWYDVEIVYTEPPSKSMHFGGMVSRAKNISGVLNIMQSTGLVSFEVQGRKITVIQH